MTELKAIFDSRKEFYGKARVETLLTRINLWSYDSLVAYVIKGTKQVVELDGFRYNSATTRRHKKELRLQVENGMIK